MLKKRQVVMLPTNEKAKDSLIYKNQEGTIGLSQTRKYYLDSQKVQHLYFLSDEEIKEGDWLLSDGYEKMDPKYLGLARAAKDQLAAIKEGYTAKKIIATTDSLIIETYPSGLVTLTHCLPHPSQSFLEVFVREYNKGNMIKELMVEYEEVPNKNGLGQYNVESANFISQPKVNPKDNTITIKRVKESWNREEMEKKLWEAWDAGYCSALNNSKAIKGLTFKEWIEQTL